MNFFVNTLGTFLLLGLCMVMISANPYHAKHHHHECQHHIIHKTKHVKVPVPVVKKVPEFKIIKVPVKVPVYIPVKEEKHYEHEEYPKHEYHGGGGGGGYHGGDDYKAKA